MFCRKCGQQLSDDAAFCTACGTAVVPVAAPAAPVTTPVMPQPAGKKPIYRQPLFWIVIAAVVVAAAVIIIAVTAYNNSRCAYCSEEATYGDYCINHVCLYGSCTRPRQYGSRYCYTHNTETGYYAPDAEDDLVFSGIEIEHNSSYTVVTGKVKNTGSTTYTFVKVKGSFQTSYGSVVDTDWTYAVGAEGLAPGESASFRMSVPKDTSISKCDISILDYDT